MYLLWSAKMQGWLTPSGVYDTRKAEAQQFSRTDALVYARRQMGTDSFGLLPVALADLEAL